MFAPVPLVSVSSTQVFATFLILEPFGREPAALARAH
jgi:hypothetical protein